MPSEAILRPMGRKRWHNWHKTVRQSIDELYEIGNPEGSSKLASLNKTSEKIEELIAKARSENRRLRAMGGGWSLSRITASDGYMLNMGYLNFHFNLTASAVSDAYPGDPAKLHLVQGGRSINKINEHLESGASPRSLRTSGAANGQSYVGAASTGTHGSALRHGAVHDQIVGMLLLTGENGRVWLEREPNPVLNDDFAARLGAVLMRDDTLFNAAQVSLGAFGIIHAVLIETRDLLILESHNKVLPYDAAMRQALDTLDVSNLPLKWGMDAPDPTENDPYFFQVIINPFSPTQKQAFVTTMYERPPTVDDVPDYALEEGFKPGYDLLSLIAYVTDRLPSVMGFLANQGAGTLIREGVSRNSFGGMFDYKPPKTKVGSASVFVPLEHTSRTVDLILDLINNGYPAPVAIVCRFQAQTGSLLGPNRFGMNCAIGTDGVHSKNTLKLFAATTNKLREAGIPFTQHWGKSGDFSEDTVRHMYGQDVDRWIAARNTLLAPADRKVFTNDFLVAAGLG